MVLYNQLMNLCENTAYKDAFYFQDSQLDNITYRIFNYRLVGWDTFQHEEVACVACEARGIMFNITDIDDIKLACRPLKKFFNYAEGSVNHAANTLMDIHEKLDGSLISSYIHNGALKLKSKGSIKSVQACDAMVWLDKIENSKLKAYIFEKTYDGYTVNMEWTSPSNRIVIGYDEDMLRILSVRDNRTGLSELPHIDDSLPVARQLVIPECTLSEMVAQMYQEQSGEGYILTFKTPAGEIYQTKVKNFKYCNLHKIKDSISNPETLAELIIRGQSDDVVEAFSDDPITIKLISDMEHHIMPIFNGIIKDTEDFFNEYGHFSRKDFAIKSQKENPTIMPLLMNKFLRKENDYERFAVRNLSKLFGIKNTGVK